MIEYATQEEIIAEIERLENGEEPTQEQRDLCALVYKEGCPWCYKGINYENYENDDETLSLCDCITEKFNN